MKNLSIDSASPEGVIVWKGEEGETATVSVTLDDNDVNDPVTLTLKLWPTDMPKLYPSTPDCYDSVVLENVSGASHTFTWDGNGGMAPPGTYTYDVEAVQTDICDTDPDIRTTDTAKYRSQHLNIWRARDEETGLPIYDVRYDGYDDKGTEGDESDDEYIYVVRHYVLTDTHQWDASGGQIWLYGPELTRLGSWDIGGLPCTLHDSCDGLSPGYHAVRIGVRTSLMDDEGTYRFVAHVKDAHGQHYRNGQDRWALDLNGTNKVRVFHIEDDWMVKPDGTSLRAPARARRLKNAFAFAGWRVKTAPDEVGEIYCTQVPFRESFSGSYAQMNSYSYESFHYYDSRNGAAFVWPFRYVHVIGANRHDGEGSILSDEVYGMASLCVLSWPPRWSFVFMGSILAMTNVNYTDAALLTTVHEIGHSAFLLPEHPDVNGECLYTTDTPMVNNPGRKKYCVMYQAIPDPDGTDYHFCKQCLNAIKSYGGGFWGGGPCGGNW